MKILACETFVTFRKPFADAAIAKNPETWMVEGAVGIITRSDESSKWSSRPGSRYLILWELPNGGTLSNYLPAGAVKEIR